MSENLDTETSLSELMTRDPERTSPLEKGLNHVYNNEFAPAIELFEADIAGAESGFPAREAYARHAEAHLGLVCCYSVLHKHRELKRAILQSLASARKAYDREEDFPLFPVLEYSIKVKDFSPRYATIIGNIGKRGWDEILASLGKFVEQNKNSFLSLLGELWRSAVLYKLKRTRECEASIGRLAALYPNSAVLMEHRLMEFHKSDPTEAMKLAKLYQTLVGKSAELYTVRAGISRALCDPLQSMLYCLKSLRLKMSKTPAVYMIFLMNTCNISNLERYDAFKIFDDFIPRRSSVLLDICTAHLPQFARRLTRLANRVEFIRARCAGLCYFELGLFDKAREAFEQACDKSLTQRIQQELGDALSPDDWFADLVNECEAKIVECGVAKARHARAAMVVRRAATEALYRPGGPGYLSAFENFRLLAASR